jgi:hypothetical protein
MASSVIQGVKGMNEKICFVVAVMSHGLELLCELTV